MSEEVFDTEERNDISENKDGNNSPVFSQGTRDVDEQEGERVASTLNSTVDQAEKPSSSSQASCLNDKTPELEPDIEGSLAYSSQRKNSIKRCKRFLPPDVPNLIDRYTLDDCLASEPPPLISVLRNAIVTAVLSDAERERQIIKNSTTPDSVVLDDIYSTSSSECPSTENIHEHFDDNELTNNADELRNEILHSEKSTKSETYLLHGTSNKRDNLATRIHSAPVQPGVECSTRCTQTEWSWLKDMENFENLKSQLEFSMKVDYSDEDSQSSESLSKHVTPEAEPEPEPEDELFKEPTMEEVSESSSDDEDIFAKMNEELLLPSIGPPKILQYVKESMNPYFTTASVKGDRQGQMDGLPDQLSGITTANATDRRGTGIVQDDDLDLRQAQVVSNEEAEDFVNEQSVYEEGEVYIKEEMIDIKPHPPFGTKAARKAAKERAAERAREREIERQKVSGNTVNFYAMTRQMKTLAYSLASTKCMDEGWTIKRPVTESTSEGEERFDPFEIKINPSVTQQKQTFFERFYTNGKRLLVIFPDGTGTCYYPSGNPAIIISSTEKGKYSYIVQEDIYEHSRDHTGVVGAFDPTGHGCCYFEGSNKLRMVLTPFGGTYFDSKGVKKKKWLWYNNHSNHVHAPPFQPVTFALTKALSVRCMGQDYIIITYNYGRHTIRFNVGARLKAAKNVRAPSYEHDYELQLREIKQFVNLVIERIRSTLRFPHSTRINRLPLVKAEPRSRSPRSRERILEREDTPAVVVN